MRARRAGTRERRMVLALAGLVGLVGSGGCSSSFDDASQSQEERTRRMSDPDGDGLMEEEGAHEGECLVMTNPDDCTYLDWIETHTTRTDAEGNVLEDTTSVCLSCVSVGEDGTDVELWKECYDEPPLPPDADCYVYDEGCYLCVGKDGEYVEDSCAVECYEYYDGVNTCSVCYSADGSTYEETCVPTGGGEICYPDVWCEPTATDELCYACYDYWTGEAAYSGCTGVSAPAGEEIWCLASSSGDPSVLCVTCCDLIGNILSDECVAVDVPVSETCYDDGSCASDEECGEGGVCLGAETGYGWCDYSGWWVECTSDADCAEGETCQGSGDVDWDGDGVIDETWPGWCGPPPPPPCFADSDCGEGERCYSAYRVDYDLDGVVDESFEGYCATPWPGECDGDAECEDGQICYGAYAEDLNGDGTADYSYPGWCDVARVECTSDADCADGEVCDPSGSGFCVPAGEIE